MPRAERSLQITGVYTARLLALSRQVRAVMVDRWRTMDPTDLDASFRIWLPAAVAMLTMGQREAVRVSDAYLAMFLSSELEQAVPPQGLNPDDYAGRTRDGRPVRSVLALSIISTKLALAQGRSMAVALDAGAARAVRTAGTETMSASRSALSDAMSNDERIIGYERVINSDNPCGACLGLADEGLRATDQGLEIHANCSCTAEPVVADVPQDVPRETGSELFDVMDEQQQDELFAGGGGAEKADLIRSGNATLTDLVSTMESPAWGLTVYETPLEALTH